MVVRLTTPLAFVACILSLLTPAFAQPALPSNLHVSPVYHGLVESIARQSPTFQAQLVRIATAPDVTVHLDVVPRIAGARAVTEMVRQSDGLTARIQVSRFDNVVELIAHEIEHVIEQIEGVHLAGGARVADSGIYAVSLNGAAFETARAARAGRTVAREVAGFEEQELASYPSAPTMRCSMISSTVRRWSRRSSLTVGDDVDTIVRSRLGTM
jgi:hypothetical protein